MLSLTLLFIVECATFQEFCIVPFFIYALKDPWLVRHEMAHHFLTLLPALGNCLSIPTMQLHEPLLCQPCSRLIASSWKLMSCLLSVILREVEFAGQPDKVELNYKELVRLTNPVLSPP